MKLSIDFEMELTRGETEYAVVVDGSWTAETSATWDDSGEEGGFCAKTLEVVEAMVDGEVVAAPALTLADLTPTERREMLALARKEGERREQYLASRNFCGERRY